MPHRRIATPHHGINTLKLIPLLAIALGTIGGVQAHDKHAVILRLGIDGTLLHKDPTDRLAGPQEVATELGMTLDNPRLKIKDDIVPAVGVTFLFTDRIGMEMALNAYKYDVKTSFGSTDPNLPATDNLNYREVKQRTLALGVVVYPWGRNLTRFHPYVSLGSTYSQIKHRVHPDASGFFLGQIDQNFQDARIDAETAMTQRGLVQTILDQGRISDDRLGGYIRIGADFTLTKTLQLNHQIGYTRAAPDLGYWSYHLGLGLRF